MNAYSITDTSITVLIKGKPFTIRQNNPNFNKVKKAIYSKNWEVVPDLISGESTVRHLNAKNVTIDGEKILFNGKEINNAIVPVILGVLRECGDASSLTLFLSKLLENPSKHAVDGLYEFISLHSLTINEEGNVIAHKGVQEDFYSVNKNKDCVVTSGVVNSEGRILNSVGSSISMPRNQISDDRSKGCHIGLHAGSFEYAKGYGTKMVLVEINPKDVVCIPHDCKCQKLRVCAYRVLDEYTEGKKIDKTIYSAKAKPFKPKGCGVEEAKSRFESPLPESKFPKETNRIDELKSKGLLFGGVEVKSPAPVLNSDKYVTSGGMVFGGPETNKFLKECKAEFQDEAATKTPEPLNKSEVMAAIETYAKKFATKNGYYPTIRQVQSALHGRWNLKVKEIYDILVENDFVMDGL